MKLLISVRNPEEVETAISGGADWIDLKEPQAGPLGAVSAVVAEQIMECVGNRLPISAALGELADWSDSPGVELLKYPSIGVVKLGLSKCCRLDNWQQRWTDISQVIAQSGQDLAAVAYADWQQASAPKPSEVIAAAKTAGSRYFLLDTYNKQKGSLLDHLSANELRNTLEQARKASLQTVLAGSLQLSDIGKVAFLEPDIMGVRGGVCDGKRDGKIVLQKVAGFRAALIQSSPQAASHAIEK